MKKGSSKLLISIFANELGKDICAKKSIPSSLDGFVFIDFEAPKSINNFLQNNSKSLESSVHKQFKISLKKHDDSLKKIFSSVSVGLL